MSSLYQLWRFENALAPGELHQRCDKGREATPALFVCSGVAMRGICALAISLVLGGCEALRPDDDLEARAKAGDVSAACDLVLQDLQQCAAARKDWISRPGSPRPGCLDDPAPADHQLYFSQSIDSLAGPPERKELLEIINDGAANTAASLKLGVGAPERFDSAIDIIAQSCETLRG